MNYFIAQQIIANQLNSFKKINGYRFNKNGYEYELKANGSWFAPYFSLRKRRQYTRTHFIDVGTISAGDKSASEVLQIAYDMA